MNKTTIKKLRGGNVDKEHLKHWQKLSTKAKIQWLDDAFEFAKAVEKSRHR